MEIEKLCVNAKSTVLEAIKQIDSTGKQILIVVEEKRLVGVITDGDVRRWILKNGDLQQPVQVIMNTKPVFISPSEIKSAKRIMEEQGIHAIPVVDKQYRPVEIVFLKEFYQKSKLPIKPLGIPVVIMAGGKGTRLYPYTQIIPKPLIPIGDTTILERIMERFGQCGCNEFYLTLNYKKNMIKSYLEDSDRSYNIHYVEEETFLGTGGSLALMKGFLNETFFVSNCDILIQANYEDIVKVHRESGNKITIVTSLKNYTIPYGVIKVDEEGQVSDMEEKPEYNFQVNTGLYVLEPEVLEDIPQNTFFHITELINDYIKKGIKIGVYPITERAWLDMGELKEMERMIKELEI